MTPDSDAFMLAEFADEAGLATAARALRRARYTRLSAYTPFASRDVEDALAIARPWMSYAAFACGALGAGGAYLLQWAINTRFYPLDVGGRPDHFPLAFVPISFEMGILGAALAAFVAVVAFGGMPCLWRPTFELDEFRTASRDRFWLGIEESDPRFDGSATAEALERLGAVRIARVGRRGQG